MENLVKYFHRREVSIKMFWGWLQYYDVKILHRDAHFGPIWEGEKFCTQRKKLVKEILSTDMIYPKKMM